MSTGFPAAPRNVRVEIDGVEHHVEMAYQGIDAEGIHQWLGTVPLPAPVGPPVVRADEIPARTAINLEFKRRR